MSIIKKINQRYKQTTCDNLSCGNNLVYADINYGETVLDLGCGSGRDAVEVAQIVGPAGKVTGIDLTPEMVTRAWERATEEKINNVSFVEGSIESLPFPDNVFDLVISNCAINHCPDKYIVFQEIYRVLKPRGRFVISDVVSKDPLPDKVKKDPQAWADCYGGAITEKEYISIISQSGFQQTEIINKLEYLKNEFEFASLTIKSFKDKGV